jgi:acyl transferase domain-containing protein/NAD(P)-dependent dehydrogenase (short-subunit alcohol dehydrogenase family)/acyl carrier protein
MKEDHCPVAIVGMSCFFPKSSGLKAYWRLLFQGQDAITEVPPSHWSTQDYFDPDPRTPDHVYCTRGGFISPVDFDPSEYGIPPSSLEATDSSQLLALAAANQALRDSGVPFDRSRTSVILGVTGTQELVIPLSSRLGFPKWRRALQEAGIEPERCEQIIRTIADSYVSWQENSFPGLLGNVVAGRISNRLDLGGTNCVVDAACASSFAAVHLALLELASGRSDTVITGGVDTLNDIFMHMCFAKTRILSPTGDARPFSKNADGTVLGEGIGMLVLKRLPDAERDGNRIYAVIKGIGSSSDGRSQSIYAPRIEGQVKALETAYAAAGIDPSTVGLVEAHGTGTRVGDKVEFQALCQVMGKPAENGGRRALGSVKSMIGHAKAAAGAAGLVKAALAVYHKVLPPTLKADEPDASLGLDASPFYLNTCSRPWLAADGQPRRAGVSAFGFGGSNFHIVLEEHRPEKPGCAWDGSVQILAFSAERREELLGSVDAFTRQLAQPLSEAAWARAAAQCRSRFDAGRPFRLLLVVEQPDRAAAELRRAADAVKSRGPQSFFKLPNFFFGGPAERGRLAFLFPGQGSQYTGMGRDLVCMFPAAMAVLQKAERRLSSEPRLSDLIYPEPGRQTEATENALRSTDKAQPAIGAVSLALLKTLGEFGLVPDALAGHSFGELTALCAGGWLGEDDFFDLAAARGRAMAQAEPGAMLAVRAPLAELEALINRSQLPVVLANRNGPDQGVLSGPRDAIAEASEACRRSGYAVKQLPVGGAFHSPLMRGARDLFLKAVNTVSLTPTSAQVFSNDTAQPYPSNPDDARRLLAEHMLRPVDFVGAVEAMHRAGVRTFVEVGPRSILTGLVGAILKDRPFQSLALDASNGRQPGLTDLACALCHLAALGFPVRLENWEDPEPPAEEYRMRVPVAGANFRSPKPPARPHRDLPSAADSDRRPLLIEPPPGNLPAASAAPVLSRHTPPAGKKNMAKNDNSNTHPVSDALRSVQEGLKTIQAIQIQTAQAHQRFLETQSEATRVLLELVKNTSLLAGVPVAGTEGVRPTLPTPSAPPPAPDISFPAAAGVQPPEPAPPASFASAAPEKPAETAPCTPLPPAAPRAARTGLETLLLTVVSELTGYPVEMLGLEMDIEADLGIDSIKRVEILSTLEEKMPGLPAVAPEDMGRLKTLGQIIDFMSGPPGEVQPAAASMAPPAETPPAAAAGRPALAQALLGVVSELTGYPVEMLGLEMDIEADLGIDSIKRVEILSTLEEKMPGLPAVAPEDMGRLKTLGQILEHLTGSPREIDAIEAARTVAAAAPIPVPSPACAAPRGHSGARLADRRIVVMTPAPALEASAISVPKGRKVFITDDRSGLSQAVMAEFGDMGINAVLVSADILKFKKDLPPAAGLLIIQNPASKTLEADLKNAFELTRAVAVDLLESAKLQAAFFATVTRMDGAFGFGGQPAANPVQGALAGLTKTAAAEWPEVICHALDIAPDGADLRETARALIREAMNRGPVEIGLTGASRSTPTLVPQDYPAGEINLQAGDAVVISGGARGITAVCALELARRVRPALVLLGRSPEPEPEPEWMHDLEGEADVKKALLQTEFAGASATPAEVERRLKQLLASREVARTLEAIRSFGAEVAYYAVDVRDAARVQTALADARSRFGPIRGLIHGAGVLEDRLIAAKSVEQFERVFDTKLKGFQSLMDALADDELKTIAIFSSVTARIGNRGQADYAMANEALNKLAWAESRRRPGCRVVSINWGPWECGMVTPSIKREFERQGVTLLPASDGAHSLLRELGRPAGAPAEVVIGGTLNPVKVESVPEKTLPALATLFEREINVENYPVLRSHVIDGQAVVPMALMAEWFGHGALHENPGLLLHGLEEMRILNGIRLGAETKPIRVLAGKARRKNGFFEVELELRNGVREGKDILHSRARAVLTEDYARPPAYRLPDALSCNHYPRSAAEIYEKILFHGAQLHGLRWVQCCTADGMVADVTGAPDPARWIAAPLRNSWLCDPLALDSAFQMASLWCFEQRGCVSLPIHAASYRQFRAAFPAEGIKVALEVREVTEKKMRGDFTFLDADRRVIARLTGFEAVMDPLLNRAFKPDMNP